MSFHSPFFFFKKQIERSEASPPSTYFHVICSHVIAVVKIVILRFMRKPLSPYVHLMRKFVNDCLYDGCLAHRRGGQGSCSIGLRDHVVLKIAWLW